MDNLTYNILFAVIIIWSMIWQGIALWKSARNGQMAWFIAIMIINLVGILAITYILFFQKKKEEVN